MPDMDHHQSTKPPQISEMFSKFALAFKTKTIEFFAEEEQQQEEETTSLDDFQTLNLLDSTEEIRRVVVIKPDSSPNQQPPSFKIPPETLIPSVFATISSFEVSYLQLQTAHSPFHGENIEAADRSAISHLQKLTEMKKWFKDFQLNSNPNFTPNLGIGSQLEAQVQENQSLLRSLEMLVNRLQSEIDSKDADVLMMKQKLKKSEESNLKLSKRLSNSKVHSFAPSPSKLLSITVFDAVLHYVCKSCHRFTKILVELMKRVGWDLDSAANYVYPDAEYAKIGHNRYAFLSYVCLGMFQSFDSKDFGVKGDEIECSSSDSIEEEKKSFLKQFLEHASGDAMDILNKNPRGCFGKFCELKYQLLIHPTMESSLFKNMDQNELVLNLWRSSAAFYHAFVDMAGSVWMLHNLAFSFDPNVEIFQVDRGVDYSMIYMENVTGKGVAPGKSRAKVAFTVIPGFKIGKTVVQSRVYLQGNKLVE